MVFSLDVEEWGAHFSRPARPPALSPGVLHVLEGQLGAEERELIGAFEKKNKKQVDTFAFCPDGTCMQWNLDLAKSAGLQRKVLLNRGGVFFILYTKVDV